MILFYNVYALYWVVNSNKNNKWKIAKDADVIVHHCMNPIYVYIIFIVNKSSEICETFKHSIIISILYTVT